MTYYCTVHESCRLTRLRFICMEHLTSFPGAAVTFIDQIMDPLLPVLCLLDTSVPKDRQQCVLQASKEAKAYKATSTHCPDPKTAYKEAQQKCQLVTASPTETDPGSARHHIWQIFGQEFQMAGGK
ncbi:hypothetical protein NL108_009657 [Boleophthalmus pectinirostris]|nr:hypothetical protein NL108_009657 [Boleophthalmus pectinirostris]